MKTTTHGAKNLFASFLAGMALAVVLGSMFALSSSAFAMGGGGGGSAPAPKVTKVDDPVAKPKDEVAGVKKPVVEPDGQTPAVGELRTKEPEEKTLVIEDPAEGKTVNKPDERTIEFPKLGDKTGKPDDGIADVSDDVANEADAFGARVGFATPASVADEGSTAVLRIELSRPVSQPVTVSVAHPRISVPDSLVFAPGETSKEVEVAIPEVYNDITTRFVLRGVSFPVGVGLGQLVHRVRIVDNDSDEVADKVTVGFTTSASEVTEGDSLLLRVELSEPLSQDFVMLALAPVGDVVISSRHPDIVLWEGETSAVLEITAVDDEQVEGTETVTYVLTGGPPDYLPEGVRYDIRTHTVTIIDNDNAENDQVAEVGDSVEEVEDETGDTVAGPGVKIAGTAIATTAEVATETFPVLRWEGERSGVPQPSPITTAITSGAVDGDSVGVRISRAEKGGFDFINDASIDNVEYGIQAASSGSDRFSITNNAKITNAVYGVDARHTGTGTLQVGIGHKGVEGWNWLSPTSFLHPVRSSEITALQRGIFTHHTGSGRILVDVETVGKVVSKEGNAIIAEHDGKGSVRVEIEGEVRGARTAVVAKQNNKGEVWVYVRSGGEVYGDVGGITAEGGNIFVDLAGKVFSGLGESGIAVDIVGTRNELTLRPGFSSNGKIVARGGGSLELLNSFPGDPHPTERIGYLDLGVLRGFDAFEASSRHHGKSSWWLTSAMGEGEAFRRAYLDPGSTLRLTNADFKMAEWVHRDGLTVTDRHGVSWEEQALRDQWCSYCNDYRWSSWGWGLGTFRMGYNAALEIVGDNVIQGNLSNKGDGYSSYGGIRGRYPHLGLTGVDEYSSSFIVFDSTGREDRLTVTGDYRGRGSLVFDVGLDGWDENDRLTIEGSAMRAYVDSDGDRSLRTNSRVLIGTPEEGTPLLGEESPVLIEVRGGSDADAFFGTQDVGAFRYVLEHETFGEVAPDIDGLRWDVIQGYYLDLLRRADSDRSAARWEERKEARETWERALVEARKVRDDAQSGKALGDAHKALAEELADLPSEEDFEGYRTWRFRRNGPSALAVRSSALAPILSKSGGTLETPLGSHKDRDKSGLGFRAGAGEYVGGIWGRQQNLRVSQDLGVTAAGSSRTSGESIHFGYDMPAMNFMGGNMVLGASMWHGTSTSDVSSSVGTSGIDVRSQAAALMASWWSPEGLYASGQTQYVRFLSDISADGLSLVEDNEGIGITTSAELGYRFAVPLGGMEFEVAPQAQLVWSHVGFKDFAGLQGELVSLEDGDLVTGRLGLSWDGEWQTAEGFGRIYGGMNLRGAVDGKTSVNISGVSIFNEQKGLSVDGKLGLSYEWNEGYVVYGEASAMHHEDVDEIRADLGVRIDF